MTSYSGHLHSETDSVNHSATVQTSERLTDKQAKVVLVTDSLTSWEDKMTIMKASKNENPAV